MITSAYSVTATERVLPKLALDFTSATLDSRITFSRPSATATKVNASGVVEIVNADTPRFDYDPVTLACKGLFIEETRENKITYSEDLSNGIYVTGNTSVGSVAFSSPRGNVSYKVTEDTADSTHLIFSAFTFTAAVYTVSFYLKAAGRTKVQAYVRDFPNSDNVYAGANIDLTAGTASALTGTATIINSGNGWYRVTINGTMPAAVASITFRLQNENGSLAYTGDGTSGMQIWGLQVELASFATSYIPTSGAAATRNADVATITGTNFSSFWRAGRGGVLVRALPSTVNGTRPLVQFDDASANNIISLRGNTTNPELYIVNSATPQAQIDAGTIAACAPYTLTGWWQTDFCAARLNTSAKVIDNSATIPTVTQARLGSDGTNYLNGHLATINYYDKFSGQIYTRRKNKAVFSVI